MRMFNESLSRRDPGNEMLSEGFQYHVWCGGECTREGTRFVGPGFHAATAAFVYSIPRNNQRPQPICRDTRTLRSCRANRESRKIYLPLMVLFTSGDGRESRNSARATSRGKSKRDVRSNEFCDPQSRTMNPAVFWSAQFVAESFKSICSPNYSWRCTRRAQWDYARLAVAFV